MLKPGDTLEGSPVLLRIAGEVYRDRELFTTNVTEVYEDLALNVFYKVKNGVVMALTTNRAYAQAWLANDQRLRDLLEL